MLKNVISPPRLESSYQNVDHYMMQSQVEVRQIKSLISVGTRSVPIQGTWLNTE
jgi:hypothetical protein